MLLDKYAYSADSTCHQYEFCSEGPNGKIRKIIEYSYFQINGKSYYNLAFGDWDDTRQDINDLSVSNNGDRKKILATIAASVIEFTDHFQRYDIYVQGSTPARTRLYQMSIAAHLEEINDLFVVKGLRKDMKWELFAINENYLAFLVIRK